MGSQSRLQFLAQVSNSSMFFTLSGNLKHNHIYTYCKNIGFQFTSLFHNICYKFNFEWEDTFNHSGQSQSTISNNVKSL